MQCTIEQSSDGRRLVQVTYESKPENYSEVSAVPMLKTTFELYIPEDFTLKANTQALFHLSTVRLDTLEKVSIEKDTMREVMNLAVKIAAEDDPDW